MLKELINLLFPRHCYYCNIKIKNYFLCNDCYSRIQQTNDHLYPNNTQIYHRLKEFIPINEAMSFCFFYSDNPIQILIHALKYKNRPNIGAWLGEQYGKLLKKYNFDKKYDIMIPIPLHKKRLKMRGYNQSSMFAMGLSKILNIDVDENVIIRNKNTKTQTEKDREERFNNMEDVFKIIDGEKIRNKRVVIIDDIITTGATVISMSKEILKYNPKSINVITIATAIS